MANKGKTTRLWKKLRYQLVSLYRCHYFRSLPGSCSLASAYYSLHAEILPRFFAGTSAIFWGDGKTLSGIWLLIFCKTSLISTQNLPSSLDSPFPRGYISIRTTKPGSQHYKYKISKPKPNIHRGPDLSRLLLWEASLCTMDSTDRNSLLPIQE